MSPVSRLAAVAPIFACLAVACGSPTPGGTSNEDSGAFDVVDEVAEDTALIDASEDDGSGDDVLDASGDAGAAPGAECEQDEDCASGMCIDLAGSDLPGLCTIRCISDSDCPRDFDCVILSSSGTDAERVCLPVDLCIDADDDGFGFGPGCAGDDCDDSTDSRNLGNDELCDGIDNDCDERVDDGVIDNNLDCDTGLPGRCSEGRTTCADGIAACTPRLVPEAERCDAIDNDCDGMVDEGEDATPLQRPCYDGDVALVGVGACARGAQVCVDGGLTSCVGQVLPSTDVCDGVDNDCDGQTDEGLAVSTFYRDADNDGFGDARAPTTVACGAPSGFVANSSDCDDDVTAVRPGAAELPGDEVDQNCDGAEFCYVDADRDGYRNASAAISVSVDILCDAPGEATAATPGGDCNDDDESVHPLADDVIADGDDSDCDGIELCYVDADGDGWRPDDVSTVASTNRACTDDGEAGAGAGTGDCDDDDRTRNPGAVDVCDDVDNDCDGVVDGGGAGDEFWPDFDLDGYGDATADPTLACAQPDGYVADNSDCDDLLSAIHPDALELPGDAVDQNCDFGEFCFADGDNDTYRAANLSVVVSTDSDCDDDGEALATASADDCNDGNANIRPGATELLADGVDQNCDYLEICYVDADDDLWRPDAFSTISTTNLACGGLGEAVAGDPVGDCNDLDPSVNFGAVERAADGIDQDCNTVEVCFADLDNDGYRPSEDATVFSANMSCSDLGEAMGDEPVGDCNDGNTTVHPGAGEAVADGVDQNCDGAELCYADVDNDGYRPNATATVTSVDVSCAEFGEAIATDPTTDCNDNAAAARPGLTEICDDLDNDCDGAVDEGFTQNACADITCTGANRLVTSVRDGCINDGGGSGGGDALYVFCINGLERYCLSGESCPWIEWRYEYDWSCDCYSYNYYIVAPSTPNTCSTGGLSSRYMATATCDAYRGRTNYYCDGGNIDFQ